MQKDMRKMILALAASLLLAGCHQQHVSQTQRKADSYALVHLETTFTDDISDHGKKVLELYKLVAEEADNIYWDNSFGDKSLMENLEDAGERAYAKINYGPWDRIDDQAFVEGYGERPAGANFYPADMTAAEFLTFDDPDKDSRYTLIRRDADGSLKTVWYHDAYKDNIERICDYLRAAADATIVPSVREFLLKKIEGLRTDNYYESDLAWLEMDDSKMDLVIGPNETTDDRLFGQKASYGACVMLKDVDRTESLKRFTAMLPELQQSLPCEDAYKTFVPGAASNIFVCDAIYYAGSYNAGFKVIALNLPYDEQVQAEKGTRTILFRNVLNEKFFRTVFPVGKLMFTQSEHLDAEAFWWNIAFREVAHGLGVKQTVNGRGTVAEALGNESDLFEELKGNVLGVWLACNLNAKHNFSTVLHRNDFLETFVASTLRSTRFGAEGSTGMANIAIWTWLVEKGALTRNNETDVYTVHYDKAYQALTDLAALILKIQATGDATAARKFAADYGKLTVALQSDIRKMHLEEIPVDIRFE